MLYAKAMEPRRPPQQQADEESDLPTLPRQTLVGGLCPNRNVSRDPRSKKLKNCEDQRIRSTSRDALRKIHMTLWRPNSQALMRQPHTSHCARV